MQQKSFRRPKKAFKTVILVSSHLLMETEWFCIHSVICFVFTQSFHTSWQGASSQSAFYVNLYRAVIGPSATLTGRWRPDVDLRRMLAGLHVFLWKNGENFPWIITNYTYSVTNSVISKTFFLQNPVENFCINSLFFVMVCQLVTI